MGRIACAYIARFELAVRARTIPGLWERVLAIADLASARARLLAVTPAAERCGLHAGLSLNEALALHPSLELRAPDPLAVQQGEEEIRVALGRLSPALDADGLGAFFVTADGLDQIHGSELVLARRMKVALHQLGYDARIGLADRPLAAWVAARRSPTITRVPPGQDADALADVPLSELGLPPPVLERLELLGVQALGQLAALPPGTLSSRLPGGERLERFCRGEEHIAWPTQGQIPVPPESFSLDLDMPVEDIEPLLFLFKSLLDKLLISVAQTRRSLAELRIAVRLDDRSELEHRLTPATPTLESRVLMDLLRLWLTSGPFPSAVAAIRIVAARVEVATARQLQLFQQGQERADDAFSRAVARVSAAFGAGAAVRPYVVDTFRPEARVGWAPATQTAARREQLPPPPGSSAPVVLHLLPRPEPIQWRDRQVRRADGTTTRVHLVDGPHRLCGEWWSEPFDRSYYWITGGRGERFWVFRDELSEAPAKPIYLHALAD